MYISGENTCVGGSTRCFSIEDEAGFACLKRGRDGCAGPPGASGPRHRFLGIYWARQDGQNVLVFFDLGGQIGGRHEREREHVPEALRKATVKAQ